MLQPHVSVVAYNYLNKMLLLLTKINYLKYYYKSVYNRNYTYNIVI